MADNRGINAKNLSRLEHTYGAVPFVFSVLTEAGTASYTLADNLGFNFRVIDAWCVAVGAGGVGDTVTIYNGADIISNGMDLNIADKTIARAGTLDDAYHTIAPSGSLKVVTADDAVALVYVKCVREDA